MTGARQKEKIAIVGILQDKPNSGFCAIWRKVCDCPYHHATLHRFRVRFIPVPNKN